MVVGNGLDAVSLSYSIGGGGDWVLGGFKRDPVLRLPANRNESFGSLTLSLRDGADGAVLLGLDPSNFVSFCTGGGTTED